jgi:hypothetical protein
MRELNEPDRKFIRCEMCWDEAIDFDTFCEQHQRCDECGEREICDNDCIYQPLISQYNRNREFKDFIYSINEIK